jgi:putative DNA primase/helicase
MTMDANDIARQEGVASLRDRIDSEPKPNGHKATEIRPPEFTDEALALRFAERHARDLRYVAAWGRWLSYDGVCWCYDNTLFAFDCARRICREASAKCTNDRIASLLASAKTVAAVERLAKADRLIAADVDRWDADPWLLNTPAGVVDLKTGRVRSHRPGDHLTKVSGVSPDTSCPIPLWIKLLERISAGDAEMIGFLRRVAGYSLTGVTREHAIFFLYGTGSNGKTTF